MASDTSELWACADRSGQLEYRTDCPHCSKRKGDKTLSLNTQKRVGKCHRCEWAVGGEAPQHFVEKHLDDNWSGFEDKFTRVYPSEEEPFIS